MMQPWSPFLRLTLCSFSEDHESFFHFGQDAFDPRQFAFARGILVSAVSEGMFPLFYTNRRMPNTNHVSLPYTKDTFSDPVEHRRLGGGFSVLQRAVRGYFE
jgi:hypothetical protein